MKKALQLVGISSIAVLSGCSFMQPHNVSKPNLGPQYELKTSESNPSPGGAQRSKVVVYEVDNGGLRRAKKANMTTPVLSQLSSTINGAGAELVDRDLAQDLEEEIDAAQAKGSGSYGGAPVADYAVRSRLTDASFGSNFDEAYTDEDGNTYPATCTYTASAEVAVDVFTVPELNLVKSLIGSDTESTTEDTRSSSCRGTGDGMLRSAGKNAIIDIKGPLSNFFAPIGYVVNAMSFKPDEDKVALKTSLTSSLGAKPGGAVTITTVEPNGDRYDVAEGEIGEPVVQSGAVVVVDKEKADIIKIGDEVSPDYSCSWAGCKMDDTLSF